MLPSGGEYDACVPSHLRDCDGCPLMLWECSAYMVVQAKTSELCEMLKLSALTSRALSTSFKILQICLLNCTLKDRVEVLLPARGSGGALP